MLELKKLVKKYHVGDQDVMALNGVNIKFRKSEFVSILGPSGCGKTTLLNIVGGLDRYTSGDLLINGESTKNFKDSDWDAYRNGTIGFVFQNYNLISHLSVRDNVEMALTLSGVSAKERKIRAIKVLTEVGLADQITKKPNQLSGGQMQRVAIARALVNNPKILLADEPTGALDSKTSNAVIKLIKEISKDRLVIMVTHNAKIANQYSDRIINLLDGEVISDTNGADIDNLSISRSELINKKTKMSYVAAIKTSFKNLVTKKGRTLITTLAGSIGIIGIALVLAISSGMTTYVNEMQSDTLAGFPISIDSLVQTDAFGGPPDRFQDMGNDGTFPDENVIYSYNRGESVTVHKNVISEEFITYLGGMDTNYYNSISYTSSVSMNVVTKTTQDSYQVVEVSNSSMGFFSNSVFSEIPDNEEFIKSQYDLLEGTYPSNANELLLVIDNKNQLEVGIIEALGLNLEEEYDFADLIGKEFKIIPNNDYYTETMGIFIPNSNLGQMFESNEAITTRIVGIVRVNEEATSELLSAGIGYTTMLTDELLQNASNSDIVLAQVDQDINVLTGLPFNAQITYDLVMQNIGGDSTPSAIQIYPSSFEAKDEIKSYIDDFNTDKPDEEVIIYSDLAEVISSTIGSLISTITIILSAFAGISLVVSSIMIGIITYVSVIERTKEIGIMKSLGARKKDISRIFNAETLIVGFGSGVIGIGLFLLLQFPLNKIIQRFIEVEGFASLPMQYAFGLILLSSTLTLVSGLIPASIAAKKDPVVALRTE